MKLVSVLSPTSDRAVSIQFFVTACDPEAHPKSPAPPHVELPQDIFDDAKKSLSAILAAHKHRDGPRVVALLRPLTKHQILRERLLTPDVLETLVKLLDAIVSRTGGNFGQAMDGLNCLLQCGALVIIVHSETKLMDPSEDTRKTIIEKLGANYPNSNVSRVSRILEVNGMDHSYGWE